MDPQQQSWATPARLRSKPKRHQAQRGCHPGSAGGGIFHGGKLCCIRTTCPKNWRGACNGLRTADCRKKHCKTVLAPDGAVCDVSPCVQGLCWLGVCMGGGLPTCPSHREECMQLSRRLRMKYEVRNQTRFIPAARSSLQFGHRPKLVTDAWRTDYTTDVPNPNMYICHHSVHAKLHDELYVCCSQQCCT
ncbi:hypothetical protein COO60DRAFT_1696375 [Scenedesmus sp. NREL 46B-D3]|nr:hypothetical protein COO60DRAFT_1696375 [Scenedesmus sp. NREL 46B-D3]